MNLPPDKARLLRQYDNEKKWDLICDQVRALGAGPEVGGRGCLGLDKAAGPEPLTTVLGAREEPWPGPDFSPHSLPVPKGLF